MTKSRTIEFSMVNSAWLTRMTLRRRNSWTEHKEWTIDRFHERDVIALHRITLLAFIAKRVKSPGFYARVGVDKHNNLICRQKNY